MSNSNHKEINGLNINNPSSSSSSRRSFINRSTTFITSATALTTLTNSQPAIAQPNNNGLPLTTSESTGLKWADAKVGQSQSQSKSRPLEKGQEVSIDYSIASTAGRFPQIYTTKDKGAPYRFTLGDGSTIEGIELAILGDEAGEIPPMKPGGIRRVIVPANLGYEKLMQKSSDKVCISGEPGSIGPIPPKDDLGAYQRWYSFYCNPRIPYQPDLVIDIKLYGKR